MAFDFNAAATAAAITAAGLSVLTKVFERIVLSRRRPLRFAINSYRTANAAPQALEPALERLEDAKDALARQKAIASANRWMSTFLITGQYIVGGLLASSFIQQSLAKEIVGALGVVVLLSSLIYQRFRPDMRFRGASRRVYRLTALIRSAEDDLVRMRSGIANPSEIDAFRKKISDTLSEVEMWELQDLLEQTGQSPDTTKR
ncbi:MAG TPA: hypothetical protein VEX43_00990 [Chthoniobacterales bacterium]|nr:hypothetical protein [Chthoniobacterales bacterium]